MDQPSTRFDGCGLLSEGDDNNFEEFDSDNFGYIIPSKVFNSFSEFINALKIPYYEDDFEIIVVADGDDCFNNNNTIKINNLIFLSIIIFILF